MSGTKKNQLNLFNLCRFRCTGWEIELNERNLFIVQKLQMPAHHLPNAFFPNSRTFNAGCLPWDIEIAPAVTTI